jgi:hypothetical protein
MGSVDLPDFLLSGLGADALENGVTLKTFGGVFPTFSRREAVWPDMDPPPLPEAHIP